MTKQTLNQAVFLARSGKSHDLYTASRVLIHVPVGGWPETRQAFTRLAEMLPDREARAYTIEEFVAEMYVVRGADAHCSGRYYPTGAA